MKISFKLHYLTMTTNNDLFFADAFLKEHFDRIVDWAVGDIKRCCRMNKDGTCNDGGALVGAFILWCCAIEYFGGLYTGNAENGGTKERYKGFMSKYMNRYDHEKVYDLRWSLLHYYSPHHFALMHENNLEASRNIHLTQTKQGIILHLGWSINDLENAVNQYKADLNITPELKIKAWRYYKKQLPIMPIKVETLTPTSLNSSASLTSISASGTVSEITWTKRF